MIQSPTMASRQSFVVSSGYFTLQSSEWCRNGLIHPSCFFLTLSSCKKLALYNFYRRVFLTVHPEKSICGTCFIQNPFIVFTVPWNMPLYLRGIPSCVLLSEHRSLAQRGSDLYGYDFPKQEIFLREFQKLQKSHRGDFLTKRLYSNCT